MERFGDTLKQVRDAKRRNYKTIRTPIEFIPIGKTTFSAKNNKEILEQIRDSANFDQEKLESISKADIQRELDMSPDMTVQDLKILRKSFAKQNHPDVQDPGDVKFFEKRMQIANMIIDTHINNKSGI